MADKYGVTPEGFKRPRLPEIKAGLEKSLSDALGVTISTRPDSIIGQLIGVFSYAIADVWEQMEAVYYSMYPNTALGNHLDNAVAFSGVYRISAERTKLVATCYGVNGTHIPGGSRIKSSSDPNSSMSTIKDSSISVDSTSYAEIAVARLEPGTSYSLTIDGKTYNYQAASDADETALLVGLSALIAGSEFKKVVSNGRLIIDKEDQRTGNRVSVSTNLRFVAVGSPVEFVCEKYGPINPPLGTVNQIVSQIAGWDKVANNASAVVGRDSETDTELRLRYARSVYTKGAALVEAMQARLYEEITGVTAALVFENDSDSIDSDGRPPHSIEAVVQGGDVIEIGRKLWETKPPGIDTFGSVAVQVTDSQGVRHTLRFNRPAAKKVWLKVSLSKNPDEEFPGDTPQRVAQLILEEGRKLRIGENVVLQRFLGPIYRGTLGIGNIAIMAAVSDVTPAAGAYSAVNIPISVREVAELAVDRIEVTIQP